MEGSILLFDGVCNLCSGFVQFVLKHEKDDTIKFASLQSETGQQMLREYKISQKGLESIVFIENNSAYEKSTAVLKISKHLKFPWVLFSKFVFLPSLFRDNLYDFVARNRYRIFGKKEMCWIPEPKWENRFLD